MITTLEALHQIHATAIPLGSESIPLSLALGRVLQEDWHTDRDLPPYDRIMMDGIAIVYEPYKSGQRIFKIAGIAAAGSVQQQLENNTHCLEVMTGAVMPKNADTVIRYEDIVIKDGTATIIDGAKVKPHQNVHKKGLDRKAGELIVAKGTTIGPAEIGVGASFGKVTVKVSRLPKVMVISTGDELVEIDQTPLPHQIRKSNVYQIKAALDLWGLAVDIEHLNDDKTEIKNKLSQYLESYDALILSGGVSKGKFDFLPEILESLNVEKLFHRVAQRPGKPFWFGKKDGCTVFALPGNPISSFLCLHKYFREWLILAVGSGKTDVVYGQLGADVEFSPDLTYFLEVRLESDASGQAIAHPSKGNGSGDLANLVKADAFIELPQGRNEFKKGEAFPIYKIR